MDKPILNGDTLRTQGDSTAPAPAVLRRPSWNPTDSPYLSLEPITKESDVSPPRRKLHADADDETATMTRVPDQKYVNIAYLVNRVGKIFALLVIIAPACLLAMPWVGTNVVIPVVNSFTKYVETQADISKSLVTISQDSVKVSAASLEQNKKVEEKLDHFTARLDASIEVQREVSDSLKKIGQKAAGDNK
jgi:hypothetical protein